MLSSPESPVEPERKEKKSRIVLNQVKLGAGRKTRRHAVEKEKMKG